MSDEHLLGRYRDSHRPEEFNELFRQYSGPLGRYFAHYLGNVGLAEDVLQDTFFQIHAKCALYRDGWPARPWLDALALHRAVDALRQTPRLPVDSLDRAFSAGEVVEPESLVELLASTEPGPLENLEVRERQQWVRGCVARLSEPLRQVVILTDYQGLSYSAGRPVSGIPGMGSATETLNSRRVCETESGRSSSGLTAKPTVSRFTAALETVRGSVRLPARYIYKVSMSLDLRCSD